MSEGTLYCVGVGPGDSELMTLKAARILRDCDVIAITVTFGKAHVAYDIAQKAVPEIAQKEHILLDFPMCLTREGTQTAYDNASELIERVLVSGRNVALLTLGDPSIYSTSAHVHKRILERGLQSRLVPGVPSFCAAAALLNEPLVCGRSPLIISSAAGGELEGLDSPGTKVYMKPASALKQTIDALQKAGKDAGLVQNCGMADERSYPSLTGIAPEPSYYSLLIVRD